MCLVGLTDPQKYGSELGREGLRAVSRFMTASLIFFMFRPEARSVRALSKPAMCMNIVFISFGLRIHFHYTFSVGLSSFNVV